MSEFVLCLNNQLVKDEVRRLNETLITDIKALDSEEVKRFSKLGRELIREKLGLPHGTD